MEPVVDRGQQHNEIFVVIYKNNSFSANLIRKSIKNWQLNEAFGAQDGQ
jgi:hypothetical protein